MNGVHDMGGMHGFGPIDRADHPLADWEWRVRVLMQRTRNAGLLNLDAFRYGIEQMNPVDYLETPYFGRWLTTVEYHLVRAGVLAEGELDRHALPPGRWARAIGAGEPAPGGVMVPTRDPDAPPRFAAGDAVVTLNIHPTGHTRLPRYARGKRGVINLVHHAQPFPDTNAHRLGEHPQPVYNVRFDASELWGDSAEPNQTVSIDLWECYLKPAIGRE